MTIYKSISEFPGYRVGGDGSVWSCHPRGASRVFPSPWRKLKPRLSRRTGYYQAAIINTQKKGRTFLLHRLILEAFKGPCPSGMECRHLDGNRLNNAADNLEWGTRKQNHGDKKTHGTTARGSRNGNSVLTESDVLRIRARYAAGETQAAISSSEGTTQANISEIVRRNTWKHIT